jgi:arylsulfatase A-like enzyme
MRLGTNKYFPKILSAGFLCIMFFLFAAGGNKNTKSAKPNFLILISDDQRWDQVSYPGNQIIPELKTPNLDKLASQGAYFTNAFVTTPICAVSRASIMTGRYVSSHGMNHFNTPLAEDVIDKTYPALLKAAGYRTGIFGKWGIGMAGTEKIFDVSDAWYNQGNYFHETDSGLIHNSVWLAAKTREFFASVTPEQPFCLTVCYKSPHHPYQPDYRDTMLFKDVVIPKRVSDTPEAYSNMAANVMEKSLNRWCYFDERKDEETRENFEKNFLRCVMSLDRSVGEVMKALQDYNLDENTVVIFLSDNGYLWGEHGLGGKWLLYEESIRVPVIIKWPGMAEKNKGELLNQLVLNIDIAPTIIEMAGLNIPKEMDGKSLLPLLKRPESDLREDFFMEHDSIVNAENPIPDSYGIRTKEWKYIRYVNMEPEVEELYHLSVDPLELNNLINDEPQKSMRTNLRQRLDFYKTTLSK